MYINIIIFVPKIFHMGKNKPYYKVIFHVIFSVVLILFFGRNCVLRPGAIHAPYKEYLSGVFVLIMIYVNYLWLIPQLFFKRRFLMFGLCAICSVLLTGIFEISLVFSDLQENISHFWGKQEQISVWLTLSSFVLLRDFGFFCFFFILKFLEEECRQQQKLAASLYSQVSHIDVKNRKNETIILDVSDIVYCEQKNNYSWIHTIDGEIYSKACSMTNFEKLIGTDISIRISRQHLVIRSFVSDFTASTLLLSLPNQPKLISLNISPKRSESVIKALEIDRRIRSQLENSIVKSKQNSTVTDKLQTIKKASAIANATPESIKNLLNNKTIEMYEYIRKHPNCGRQKIMSDLHLPKSTVERYLRKLKDLGLVEHYGNWKTGGYQCVDKNKCIKISKY